MHILPLSSEYLPAAARLFAERFSALRAALPELPPSAEDPAWAQARLAERSAAGCALAALEGQRLVGVLGWYLLENFRDTPRRGAYCPEWAVTAAEQPEAVFRALYRAAAELWTRSGCEVHALSLLANDAAGREAWFWNGFGMVVVDALRGLEPLEAAAPAGLTLRKAGLEDARRLARIEAEHWRHYIEPPIFMTPHTPDDAATFRHFLTQPENSAWLALAGEEPVGYLRLESSSQVAAEIVSAPDTIAVTGAFVRAEHRGRGLAAALLRAALEDHRARGFRRCAVDFESFNPEAAAFWPRFFQPVCYSLMRIPERTLPF